MQVQYVSGRIDFTRKSAGTETISAGDLKSDLAGGGISWRASVGGWEKGRASSEKVVSVTWTKSDLEMLVYYHNPPPPWYVFQT